MRGTLARLDGWFMAPAPPERLAMLRVLVVGYAVVYTAVRTPYWLDVARLPDHRHEPVGVLAPIDAPLASWLVGLLAAVTLVAGLAGMAGRWWAVTGPVTAAGLLVLTTHGNSWQQVFHTENLLVLHLAVLAVSPAAAVWRWRAPRGLGERSAAPGPDAAFGWPVKAMALVTVATYVLAGVAKLREGGLEWMTGDVLLHQVAHDNLRKLLLGDRYSPLAEWVVGQSWLFPPFAVATVVVELGAPVALLGGRWRTAWAASAWCFHLGVLVLMAILFPYPLAGLAYAPLFQVERLAQRGAGRRFANWLRKWEAAGPMVERKPAPRSPAGARRSRRPMLLVALALLGVLVPTAVGDADKIDDLRAERDRVQAQRAAAAAQVDARQAELDELSAALDELNALVEEQQAEVAAARAAVDAAERAVLETETQIGIAEDRMARVRTSLRQVAIDSYIGHNSDAEADMALFRSEQLSEGVRARAYLDIGSGNLGDLLDEVRALEADLEDLAQQRRAQLQEAEEARQQEEQQLEQLEETQAAQAKLVAEAEGRLEHMLSEVAALEEIDAELAGEIKAEEARIRAAIEEKLKREREAAQARRGPSSSSPGTRPAIPPPSDIVSVGGIQVHRSIADQTRALLDAAAADGIHLGGGGWRSSDRQVALRRQHCGSSDYAVWDAPPDACSPPTARPGESMHERGLAIDFTYNGRAISSRSSEAFRWLAANAGRFGFSNLPSEPWHWSVNGT